MKQKLIVSLSVVGVLLALIAAYMFGRQRKAQPPVYAPVSSPYPSAIYANGIIESDQSSGENINIYPEVSGPVVSVVAHEGQVIRKGETLFLIDRSVQAAMTEQQKSQADASLAILAQLKAQPRRETLDVEVAHVALAVASLNTAKDELAKQTAAYSQSPGSISRDSLDNATNAVKVANATLDVAQKQHDLLQAGAWSYDLASQEKSYAATTQAYKASDALLLKYSVVAPIDGVVLAINATRGSFVSPQGSYDTYTQSLQPSVILGASQDHFAVRCFVDEILVSRLPPGDHIQAEMLIRGTNTKIPLEFVRVQPYVSPKIELSNERLEQVDLRVLPVIFRFEKKTFPVYPGQLADVYISELH